MSEEEFARLINKDNPPQEKKGNKHHNIKVYVTDKGVAFEDMSVAEGFGKIEMVFDSKKEYARWEELKLLQKGGVINDLKRQSKWVITPEAKYQGEAVREIAYKADFEYIRDGVTVVEDVKPFDVQTNRYRLTKDFSLKWKLLKQKYPDVKFELY